MLGRADPGPGPALVELALAVASPAVGDAAHSKLAPVTVFPFASFATAVNWRVSPNAVRVSDAGMNCTWATVGGPVGPSPPHPSKHVALRGTEGAQHFQAALEPASYFSGTRGVGEGLVQARIGYSRSPAERSRR